MYDDDESTKHDPRPWGAQQRLLPRRGFKLVVSLPGLPPEKPRVVAEATIPAQGTIPPTPAVRARQTTPPPIPAAARTARGSNPPPVRAARAMQAPHPHAPPAMHAPHPPEQPATYAIHGRRFARHSLATNASNPYSPASHEAAAPDLNAPVVIEPARVSRDAPTLPTGQVPCLPEKPPGRFVAALRRLLGR